ncbi:AAA family ATPase [Priestia koreensis]|uniref:AAA family ATPase n=1 Tax=Priestia koreensis TaxID=284581 RepID=UPI001F58E309|nr:AAA family ATPase [Priestia koreensis]UNL86895.1 ATP-binding protein [Priestia koreensis]
MKMDMSSIIIVCCPPAAGKTVLSKRIASSLHLPLLSKDQIKTDIYDAFVKNEIVNDQEVSIASYAVLFNALKELIKAKVDVVIESNFDAFMSPKKLLGIKEEMNFRSLTIICSADLEVLHRRFIIREHSNERHPNLVTLATGVKANIPDWFYRNFSPLINFQSKFFTDRS